MNRFRALLFFVAVVPTASLADPLPAPTFEASKVDVMGLRLGMSPDQIKPLMEAAQAGIQVNVQESWWPDGTKYVSELTGNWKIPNKNNPGIVTRSEIIRVHFSAPVSGNRSFWITRQAAFFDGQEVSKDATLRALVDKYGAQTDIGRVGIDYKWAYGNLNAYSDRDQFWRSWGECANERFSSNCPDAFLTVNATVALVPTLLSSMYVMLKDNKYGLASLRYDERARADAKKAADEKAGKIAGAPRL